ncbi:MAG: branched-chain amino acid ABC transporter permease [Spirochaetes bacterium]|nr:branched-chain amino acid ABC transporter permease [Spirochaetota bacterium]
MISTILDIAISGLLLGGIYAIIAVGLSLQYGVARVFNVAHGEFIMIGAFATFVLHTVLGINPLISLVIAGPFVLLIGFIIHKTILRSLLQSSYSMEHFEGRSIMLCFGLMYVIVNIAILIFTNNQRGYNYLNFPVDVAGATFQANRLVTLVFAIGIAFIFYLFLARTRTGKAIRASSQDPATAGLMGVNINNVLALCFGLGTLMASFAGSLISMCYSIRAMMGMEYTMIALIVVILGGMGSITGSFIGGLILGIVGSIVTYLEPGLVMVAFYLIFILLLLIKPTGIMGK